MTLTPNLTIGQLLDDGPLKLDLWTLFLSRALIVGSSGYGKSWLMRVLAEQTIPRVQTIILDPEGEYSTLREKFDLLVVGAGADVAPDIDTARLLARKLAETKVSAVIDLYDVAGPGSVWDNRRAYVAEFVDGLMTLPKSLWTPMVLPIDESHWFASQNVAKKDSIEGRCATAVKNLFGAGRKRKLCAIVATQRLTKLHNDVIAEAKNVFITGVSLTDDKKRAGELLGMDRGAYMQLHRLEPGTFYAYGPALNHRGVVQFKSAAVQTTHPSPDQKHDIVVPEPSKAISALVAQMGDLPKEVKAEKDLVASLQREVVTLKRELHARPTQIQMAPAAAPVVERVEVPVITDAQIHRLEAALAEVKALGDHLSTSVDALGKSLWTAQNELSTAIKQARLPAPTARSVPAPHARPAAAPRPAAAQPARTKPSAGGEPGAPSGGERKILTALAQYPQGRSKVQVAILAGYAHNGGGYNNYLGSLRAKAWIQGDRERLMITDAGLEALGAFEPLPSGRELVEHWQKSLSKAERLILNALISVYPDTLGKVELAEQTGYESTGGGFNNALGKLRTLELIHGSHKLKASDAFFE